MQNITLLLIANVLGLPSKHRTQISVRGHGNKGRERTKVKNDVLGMTQVFRYLRKVGEGGTGGGGE